MCIKQVLLFCFIQCTRRDSTQHQALSSKLGYTWSTSVQYTMFSMGPLPWRPQSWRPEGIPWRPQGIPWRCLPLDGVFPFRLIPIRLIPFRLILGLGLWFGLGLGLGLHHDALKTAVSNNFVHIRRIGIRRNGTEPPWRPHQWKREKITA